MMAVRNAVSKELEKSRAKGEIGASLTAEVQLYCSDNYLTELQRIEDELHFVFITSAASIQAKADAPEDAVTTEVTGIKLKVITSEKTKCVRCWHQRTDIGLHAEHPELCGRCVANVAGSGEVRHYA